jgi:starch-binding outer membrane protein, SusD/RagB family
MTTRIFRQSVRRVLAAAAVSSAMLTLGCSNVKDDLLAAEDPDIIPPSALTTPEAADALRIGALARLRNMTAGSGQGDSPWMFSGLLTDEWKSGDTFSQRNETDQRTVQENNANLNPVYRDIHRARTASREALDLLVKYKPTPASNLGQMYFVMAFAEMQLAEWFCNGQPLGDASTGTPEYGPPLTNQAIFTLALAHLDSALSFTTATDAATVAVKNSILVAKGRVLVDLARYADAATAVASVPTSYTLNGTFSLTGGNNQIWALSTSAKRWVVGDSFDTAGIIKNAIPFASAKDPRVPNVGSPTGTSAAGKSFDGSTNFISQSLFGRVDPTPIVNGIDARLIEAEAKIATNDFAGMTAILNALRAAPQNLGVLTTPVITPALAAPATKAAALDQFFREKAFWTYSRGQRLGDLRRLIRQYGRTQDNVFPTGTFFKGGNYGTDVNFPVHVDEQNNPEFKGCADRAA